jgi:hypothetical protein
MNPVYECSICGKETFEVDMDYLIGTDHISCLLSLKNTKIENWSKLEGSRFDVMGVSMHLEDTKIDGANRYTVWIYEHVLETNEALMRVDLYTDVMEIDIKTFIPTTFSSPPHHTNKKITKDHIKSPSIFVQTIGQMMMGEPKIRQVLDYLSEVSGNVGARGGMTGGIFNTVMNAGTSVTYSIAPNSGLSGSSGNKLW